jgi:quercetin dioxygenase-like cupin family protein
MTMSKMKMKLMFAGVAVGCAFGLIALRFASATPSSGPPTFSNSFIAGPVVLDAMDIKSETSPYDLKLKTKGLSQARIGLIRIQPGGFSGWHSHPGPDFAMVTQGTLTRYEAGDPQPQVFPAGTGFVEEPGSVHIARNEGITDVEIHAFFLTPFGAAPTTSEPEPE